MLCELSLSNKLYLHKFELHKVIFKNGYKPRDAAWAVEVGAVGGLCKPLTGGGGWP